MKKLEIIIIILLLLILILIPIRAHNEEISNVIEPIQEIIITPEPTPEPTPGPTPTPEPKREVHITTTLHSKTVEVGTEVTMSAVLINFTDEDNCTYVWQYSTDGKVWNDIPNSNNPFYTFIVSETNYRYYWRVCVHH